MENREFIPYNLKKTNVPSGDCCPLSGQIWDTLSHKNLDPLSLHHDHSSTWGRQLRETGVATSPIHIYIHYAIIIFYFSTQGFFFIADKVINKVVKMILLWDAEAQ